MGRITTGKIRNSLVREFLIGGRAKSAAFSVLETVIVVAVMAILFTVIVPSGFEIARAHSLTSQGDFLHSELVLAQQTAVGETRSLQVRFYEVADKDSADVAALVWKKFLICEEVSPGIFKTLNTPYSLASGIVISGSFADLSTLMAPGDAGLDFGTNAPGDGGTLLPGEPVDTRWVGFRIFSNGSTSLPANTSVGDTWHLTILTLNEELAYSTGGAGAIPKNFYTLKVDPFTGRLEKFRP